MNYKGYYHHGIRGHVLNTETQHKRTINEQRILLLMKNIDRYNLNLMAVVVGPMIEFFNSSESHNHWES